MFQYFSLNSGLKDFFRFQQLSLADFMSPLVKGIRMEGSLGWWQFCDSVLGAQGLTLYVLRIHDFKLHTFIDYIVESIMEMENFIISLASVKNIVSFDFSK